MTTHAELDIDVRRRLGPIDGRVYGQMIEHVGRVVYGGVVAATPATGDVTVRADVAAAASGLRPTILRWPGGNFASGYNWRDGIGPTDRRPRRRDLAWGAFESNRFGTEEFLAYCRLLHADPYITLNMGTGSLGEALAWIDHCNGDATSDEPGGSRVRLWGLGNEAYSWWQLGATSPDGYAEAAREWAKAIKWRDHSVSLVAVGSSDPDANWSVLRTAGRWIDYLALHVYWWRKGYEATLAGPVAAEAEIVAAWGMCLAAQRALRTPRPVRIAIDEWGVWSRTSPNPDDPAAHEHGFTPRAGIDTRFEEVYDLKDALAVARWLQVLWRHPEKVTLAVQAQLVNAIAPILATDDAVVRQTVYWPVAVARALAGDVALQVHRHGSDAIDVAATVDSATGRLHVSIVNTSPDEACEVRTGLRGDALVVEISADDPEATNTREAPNRVIPVESTARADVVVVPPHSHVSAILPATGESLPRSWSAA